jgi:hypothetical protein
MDGVVVDSLRSLYVRTRTGFVEGSLVVVWN